MKSPSSQVTAILFFSRRITSGGPSSERCPGPVVDRIGFPKDYRTTFKADVTSFDNDANRQVARGSGANDNSPQNSRSNNNR